VLITGLKVNVSWQTGRQDINKLIDNSTNHLVSLYFTKFYMSNFIPGMGISGIIREYD